MFFRKAQSVKVQSSKRTLRVEVVSATNLSPGTYFVSLSLSNKRDTLFTTDELQADNLPTLVVELIQVAKSQKRVIGGVNVPLQVVESNNGNLRETFVVAGSKNSPKAVTLSLNFHMTDPVSETVAEEPNNDPNEMCVTVVNAKNLVSEDTFGLSDPYVVIKIGENSQKTKIIKQNLNPTWNERFVFPYVIDRSETIQVAVWDYDIPPMTDDYLGGNQLSVNDFENMKLHEKEVKLLNHKGEADGKPRGSVFLRIHWRHNPNLKRVTTEPTEVLAKESFSSFLLNKVGLKKGGGSGKSGKDDENFEIVEDNDLLDDLLEKERRENERKQESKGKTGDQQLDLDEKWKKEDEERQQAISNIEIKEGDYRIQIHIIEVRDLKPENYNGTSDPVIYMDCFQQVQYSKTIENVTSCVFDELFIFNCKNMTKEQFEEQIIRISCYDAMMIPGTTARLGAGKTMIGSFTIDAPVIYRSNRTHELYRRWVPLVDDEDPDDVGVQGYLKLSIQIVGPGDKLVVHNDDLDRSKDIREEFERGGDIGALLYRVPRLRREWLFLVVRVYRCEGLPIMDGKFLGRSAGTDAFCSLSFAGGKPICSKTIRKTGDNMSSISVTFNTELWYPVSVPTMTQLVNFSLWDYDTLGDNELIGSIFEKFSYLKALENHATEVRWYNIYGKQESKQDSLLENVAKAGRSVVNSISDVINNQREWGKYYNSVPDVAPAFKGRCLMQFRIAKKRPPAFEKDANVKPFAVEFQPAGKTPASPTGDGGGSSPKNSPVHGISAFAEPRNRRVMLLAYVVGGAALPNIASKFKVRICIGATQLCTMDASVSPSGQCLWNELLRTEEIFVPEDPAQIPDIFMYLLHNDSFPVCYCRIPSSKDGQLLGFNAPPKWFFMKEDKALNMLAEAVAPGSLLIKLGFGDATLAKQCIGLEKAVNVPTRNEDCIRKWSHCQVDATMLNRYQVRVHAYQAKHLPAADASGLSDPFMRISVGKHTKDTKVVKESLTPNFYEVLTFDNILLPTAQGFAYAMPVSLLMFDSNKINSHKYLGFTNILMSDGVTIDPQHAGAAEKVPMPKWYSLYLEEPGDGKGEVLISVQLIEYADTPPVAIPDIKPESRQAFLDLVIVGVRDLIPLSYDFIKAPYLEVDLASFDTRYHAVTNVSTYPSVHNPNYLENIRIPITLPKASIFASSLQIRVCDKQFGGLISKVLGVCEIDLAPKIPWRDSADASEEHALNVKREAILHSGKDSSNEESKSAKETRNGASSKLVIDSGAGALASTAIRDAAAAGGDAEEKKVYKDSDWELDEDEAEFIPPWAVGRDMLAAEYETELQPTPFEAFPFTRGQERSIFGNTLKVVGKLKGSVRILENEHDKSVFPKEMMDQLLKPKKYKVRLYALRGVDLDAKDIDIWGQPAKSDPYLRVTLGKDVFNDRQNAVDDVTDVDLYKLIEFDTELPGVSQLKIELMDRDLIGSDDLIGTTVIDLEDRWFDSRWQQRGEENMVVPGKDGNTNIAAVRWATKPIERRSLYSPASKVPQGALECWVDIMPPPVASTFPPEDVSLPSNQLFEVRVVIWKARLEQDKSNPAMDIFGMCDLFVTCWPEGCAPQETDTHWRCRKGKGSFNWRMLFDVELGHSTRAMKFPYFHLQLWDRDLLKYNDCAGEGMIDIGKYYKKAYKLGRECTLFETKEKFNATNRKDPSKPKRKKEKPVTKQPGSPNGAAGTERDDATPSPIIPRAALPTTAASEEHKGDAEDEEKANEKSPLLPEDDERRDIRAMIKQVKSMTGWWEDEIPEDSAWMNITYRDKNTGKVSNRGRICYSVQIWPKEKAKLYPVGRGQQDPNVNPYLPPPVGRLYWSWNPFVLGMELCGEQGCAYFTCCLCCAIFILLMIFAQPFLNIIYLIFLCAFG